MLGLNWFSSSWFFCSGKYLGPSRQTLNREESSKKHLCRQQECRYTWPHVVGRGTVAMVFQFVPRFCARICCTRNCWLSWKCWRLVGKGWTKIWKECMTWSQLAAPLICLKDPKGLFATCGQESPNQVRYIESQGPNMLLAAKSTKRRRPGYRQWAFWSQGCTDVSWDTGFFTLFTLLFTPARKPTGNRLDFTSIHSLLGAPACKFGFPMDFPSFLSSFLLTVIESFVGPFWISMISKYRHLEHGGFHKPTWMPAWNCSLDRMGPGSCQLCQQCDALNANPSRRFSLGSNKAFLWSNTAFHTFPGHVEKCSFTIAKSVSF